MTSSSIDEERGIYEKWLEKHYYGKSDPDLWWVVPDEIPPERVANSVTARWVYLDQTKRDDALAQIVWFSQGFFVLPDRLRGKPDRYVIAWPEHVEKFAVMRIHLDKFLDLLERNKLHGYARKAGSDERREF